MTTCRTRVLEVSWTFTPLQRGEDNPRWFDILIFVDLE